MIEKPDAEHDSDDADGSYDGRGSLGYLQGICIAAIWVFLGLLLVAVFWPNLTERTKFFTGNFFNLLIAFAVIAQVLIYRKQWHVMERQSKTMDRSLIISRRAYVGIRSIRMDRRAKTVLVEIENIGDVPAEQITLFLQLFSTWPVEIGEGGDIHQQVRKKSVLEEYGRAKLFRGNLPILLTFYLHSQWTEEEIRRIEEGPIGLIIRDYIKYANGFSTEPNDRTEFYFDYHSELDAWTAGPPDYGDIIGDEDSD